MDDKAYTCFYCHSILPYDVCISGTHFCLQATNAIEFWGNVVKIASTNSVEETDTPEADDNLPEHHQFKQENQDDENDNSNLQDGEEVSASFPAMECEDTGPVKHHGLSIKSSEDLMVDSHDGESDGLKPMNWRLKMISLVKQRPPLYDKRLPLTERTFPIRAKLWKEVYDGLNGLVPIDLLPKRFKVLRDRYNKEIKRRKLGHPPRKPWSLFKYLDFLSHAKKKICIRKMSLGGGEIKAEKSFEDKGLDRLSSGDTAGLQASNLENDDSYKENFEMKKKFVLLVGERPPLYDCRLPRPIRVAENKVKLWREVFHALDGVIPLVDLPRKFKSLRDRYMKEKKKVEAGEGPSLWPLMQYMSYLDDVAFIRSSQDSISVPTPPHTIIKTPEEKKCSEGLSLGDGVDEVEERMQALHNDEQRVNVSNLGSPTPQRTLDIIVPDSLENHKDLGESCEGLLNSLENGSSEAKDEENSMETLAVIPRHMNNTPGLGPLSPQSTSTSQPKGKGVGELISGKLKKLDLIDRLESWTEDDFFGAYLVKLMKKLPLDERLRLHIDIINMITTSLKNHDKTPVP